MNNKLQGIGASSGIAIAKAFVIKELNFDLSNQTFTDEKSELEKYQLWCQKAKTDIDQIITIAQSKLKEDKLAIFEAHKQLIDDIEIQTEIKSLIQAKQPAAVAIQQVYQNYYQIFSNMEDQYFKERASDVQDIQKRLLAIALNLQLPNLLTINHECIIVAHDLTPSETAQLDAKFVKGFLNNIGGRTSHAAIMARTLEIPAVVALKNITEQVENNVVLAMDGTSGVVEIIKDETTKNHWLTKKNQYQKYLENLAKYQNQDAVTKDGVKVLVEGNIGHDQDVDRVLVNGASSIGLFRSEFLYMDSSNWPSEEEQYQSYKKVLEKIPDHLVLIRTLDIGGDKNLKYFEFPKEMNPFLGYRALRLSLDLRETFKTQLRALLRASVHGKLGIMFPMVATLDEFLLAKQITLDLKTEMIQANIPVGDVQIGMMIEIPTTAVFAHVFSKHADFFSIGSNDLIQYSFAVDRMSDKVNYLYQPNSPALLTMIKLAIDGAHANHKMIGMCGEMAGEVLSVPLLLGLNLDAFSMSASSIPKIKYVISKLNHKECQKLVAHALTLETETEVNQLVTQFLIDNDIVWY
ncbi:Phosphoenolpyruvate-protein phosphotransferase of PTS system [[Mycoplasma] cavipharyngis]|uniref:phosphoenolpyruvate--protein phosphotransferase n=1 Tax=[Mycoplasma] cavipharyngis TaxID=92757 RepID=UPI0037048B9D